MVAKKRRINRLVVVAGPTSVGKSTFIRKMLSNSTPELAERLGVDNFSGWENSETLAVKKKHHNRLCIDRLIFHYDFLRPFGRSIETHDRDEALNILKQADRISFITLFVAPNVLKRQIITGEFYGGSKELKGRIPAIIKEGFSLSLKDLTRNLFDLKSVFGLVRHGASVRHRQILRMYEEPDEVVRLYRWWLDYLDRIDVKIENNIIFDPQCSRIYSSRLELEKNWTEKSTSHKANIE